MKSMTLQSRLVTEQSSGTLRSRAGAERRTSRSVGWSEATDDARGFDDEKAL